MQKENLLKDRIYDLAKAANRREQITYSGFLNLDELHTVSSLPVRDLGVSLVLFGGYEFAERQIAACVPDALCDSKEPFPIACLKITQKGQAFSDKSLSHRDYLGALLHLGIERTTLGDILVSEDSASVFCLDHIAEFIINSLTRVRHVYVTAAPVTSQEDFPRLRTEEKKGSVASLRLDSLLSIAFGGSRSSLMKEIRAGNVYVNSRQILSASYVPKEDDRISLRKKGKFQYKGKNGTTRKGRVQVTILRYL